MVALEVPHGCTFSPSLATPHLTINHDVAADLDSTNAFEGPEKLLEVWFAPGPKALAPTAKENGLKSVPTDVWVEMLDLVNCKILSVIHSDTVDAYLLSESSMFVFPHKIILKTCGTTTLLLGLHRLLRIAATVAGFPFHNALSLDDIHAAATPYRVFYSRKNFLFPDKQQGPHRSWKQEVKYLDHMFDGGSAYMVGKMNGDHWYLYLTSPHGTGTTPPRTPDDDTRSTVTDSSGTSSGSNGSHSLRYTKSKIPAGILSGPTSADDGAETADETLEILMTDLDPVHAKQFYLSHASAVARDSVLARPRNGGSGGLSQKALSQLSDSTFSMLDSEELFDVDDIAHSSGGSLTPMSDHIDLEALTTEGHALGSAVADNCGLSDVYPTSIYPDARVDAYMFSPCGFSANGVVPAPAPSAAAEPGSDGADTAKASSAQGVHYFTVHVTPEPNCSFASFETNVPGGQNGRQTADIVKHVVDIFRPGRFSMTLFEAKGRGAKGADDGSQILAGAAGKPCLERIPGYRRIDRIVHDFEDYDLVFRFYEREGWVGNGEARVGEL